MKRIENLKYYYKQLTKPVTLVALAIGCMGVLVGAAGLFTAVYYNHLYKQAVAERQVSQTLHAEGEVRSPLENENNLYPISYQVAAGDSLWKIAEQFYGDGCNYQVIADKNQLQNPDQLEIGMELVIPTPPQEKQAMGLDTTLGQDQADNVYHVSDNIVKSTSLSNSASSNDRENFDHFVYQVEKGDSLWFIALKYYGDGYRWTEIYQRNKTEIGPNPNLIFLGTKLNL